ncbi:MAG: hypothetical protein KM312_04985 [Hydrogenibacillus schlegelii]|uniref:Uncharacterized protein n=1 Tax=Hydrogenibacillus schlegelii TaxID=1484 RepID=A0A947CX23_HYDSH|nr:hypothetical protein [Hydrogenibacillus schlegelii]
MHITATAISDLLDRIGGIYSYVIDYDARTVVITTTAGERIELSFDDLVAWVVERMKQNAVH